MGSIERRLERLEEQQGIATPWQTPPYVLVYLKAIQRLQARENGTELLRYTNEEREELRRQDMETAAGRGAVGTYRECPGWQSPEGKEMLDQWEADARRRLARVEELGERWPLVYQEDESEEEEPEVINM